MKICIIGPGTMPIPPKGWGAVEILIDDYRKTLENLGHEVVIVNTRDLNLLINLTNALNPDFVHIQYDEFIRIAQYIQCKNIAITSHYGYLEQPDRWDPGYIDIFWSFVNSNVNIFALSDGIAEVYKKANVDEKRISVIPNGVRTDLFRFEKECAKPNESIYLAKIDPRKRQSIFQTIESIKFAGNCVDPRFDKNRKNYLGEWDKQTLYNSLTNYANLVLLSDGEAHPLVCLEAMTTGLGLVIAECASANLDLNLPFIDVIPESKITNLDYVEEVVSRNRVKSIAMREEIREYSTNFEWNKIVKDHYLPNVSRIING
jgi:glycosyltransferase involved in cell wall biosynthesis